jgi:hypothetical protein
MTIVALNTILDQENPLSMFMYALRAPESKRQYPKRLKVFLDFLTSKNELSCSDLENQCIEFMTKSQTNPKWANSKLMDFVLYQKERVYKNEIVYATIRNYLKTVKLFLEMNSDVPIVNWKRITKGLPSGKSAANDRAPTIEEIKKLVEYPDRRIKPIIYCMVSGGFRIGAWDYLKFKHISPIKNEENGEIIGAKMVIYAGEPEEYYCFITPEALNSLQSWIDYRSNAGEEITGESFLMRNLWQTTDISYGAKWGLVKYPKQLKATGVKSLIERAMKAQQLVMPLQQGIKRREWKSGHGYRKFFKSRAEQVMRPANVELLSGRDIGVSGSYYKPTQKELLEDYLKAVELLTINQDTKKLEKQFNELKERSKDHEFITRSRLQEKESEMQTMKEQIDYLMESRNEILNLLKHPEKLQEIAEMKV